jgi:hypothetical protein
MQSVEIPLAGKAIVAELAQYLAPFSASRSLGAF